MVMMNSLEESINLTPLMEKEGFTVSVENGVQSK
jgi:hypothetical protein